MADSVDEKLIVQYLLGQLPEDDEIRFEERAFADREQLQAVLAVERDLIDEYARRELSEFEGKQFEARFLNVPRRRNRIAFARVFRDGIDDEDAAQALVSEGRTRSAPPRKSFLALLGLPGWPRYAFAALAVLLVLGGVWLVTQSLRRSSPITPQQQAQTQPLAPGGEASPAPTPQVGATPEPALNAQASPSPGPAGKPPSRPIVALALSPGVARSSENVPQLVIPRGATTVQLRIGVEVQETYKDFRVELQTAAGKPIKSQSRLRAQSSSAGRTIVWQVPSALLEIGDYELALSGKNEQGRLEPLAYYYFKLLIK